MTTCPHTVEAGAYVLGALSPARREEYSQHLAGCAVCRAEVADLAGLPGLLGRLDGPGALQVDDAPAAPPSLLPSALSRLRRVRQRQRWRLALVAGLALAILGGIASIGWGGATTPRDQAPQAVVLTPMQPTGSEVQAQIALIPEAGGTRIQMHCFYAEHDGPQRPWRISLLVYPVGGGDPGPAVAVWTVTPGADVAVSGMTPLPPDRIDHLVLRLDNNGRVLLTYPVT